MKNNPLKLKFVPQIWLVIVFYFLLFLTLYVMIARSHLSCRIPNESLDQSGFYSHISNFVISYNLASIIGMIWLMQGVPGKIIVWLCAIVAAMNFVMEMFVTILNTPDIIDAYYGVAGTIFAAIILFIAKKRGMREVPKP